MTSYERELQRKTHQRLLAADALAVAAKAAQVFLEALIEVPEIKAYFEQHPGDRRFYGKTLTSVDAALRQYKKTR